MRRKWNDFGNVNKVSRLGKLHLRTKKTKTYRWLALRLTSIYGWLVGRSVREVAVLLLVFGLLWMFLGYRPGQFREDFAANFSTELISIAITVLIIDYLNERRFAQRERAERKAQLLRELESPDNGIALRAMRELGANGWLKGSALVGIDLSGANLAKADFRMVKLTKANFWNTNFEGAGFSHADLKYSRFFVANLRGATLRYANLYKADIHGELRNADLTRAQLAYANLRESDFRNAKLTEANLFRADLSPSDFREADLRWANLRGADLDGADFRGANIQGTDFRNANVWARLYIKNAIYSSKTIWPIDFNPEEAGAIFSDADYF